MNETTMSIAGVIGLLVALWIYQKSSLWVQRRDVTLYLEELEQLLAKFEQRYAAIVDISANYIHSLSSDARSKLHEVFCVIGDTRTLQEDWRRRLRSVKSRAAIAAIRAEMDAEFGGAGATSIVDPLSAFSMVVTKRIEDVAHEPSSLSMNNNLRQEAGVQTQHRKRKPTVELLRSEGFLKDIESW